MEDLGNNWYSLAISLLLSTAERNLWFEDDEGPKETL